MTQLSYRANLSSQRFPFLSEAKGRTIIVGQIDQTLDNVPAGTDRGIAIPELYYCHNVLPTPAGFASIDYVQKCGPATGMIGGLVPNQPNPFVFNMFDGINTFDYLIAGTGNSYARIGADTSWTTVGGLDDVAGPGNNRPWATKMTVNGKTYMIQSEPAVGIATYRTFYSGGIFFQTTFTFVGAPTPTLIRGVCAVAGYGVIWTEAGVFWSSSIDPLDYTPSLITGAGGGSLQPARGVICYIAPAVFGAIIYTTQNAVAMVFTGNTSYPFTFQEIKGAGGYVSDQLIASDANSSAQFAYTTFGMQALTATDATNTLSEITDFLSEEEFEDFDESTNLFTVTVLTKPLYKKFTLISNRFLVVSYGTTLQGTSNYPIYTHAIVYDTDQKRYGKLKIAHFDCWQWSSVADPTMEQLVGSIGFLGTAGNAYVCRLFHGVAAAISGVSTGAGVLLLGKYQYIRTRFLALDGIQFQCENLSQTVALRVSTLFSLDGVNNTEELGTVDAVSSVGKQRGYFFDAVGMNHSLLLVGPLNLSSLTLDFHPHGRY